VGPVALFEALCLRVPEVTLDGILDTILVGDGNSIGVEVLDAIFVFVVNGANVGIVSSAERERFRLTQ
jgi:hypothetical protein